MTLADEIRAACARVAAGARHVRVHEDRVEAYAAGIERLDLYPAPSVTLAPGSTAEQRAAFHLVCDAVNFGSGWFPTLRKRAGRSGSFTVMLGLRDFFSSTGGWDAETLSTVQPEAVAAVLGQDPGHELMALYAEHLRELGARVTAGWGGSFAALAAQPQLARELATWPGFADVADYDGRPVPFFKRAQLTAYDMVCAGLASPGAEGDLTTFADNLVPHVLRVDGLLSYDDELIARIGRGELLEAGGAHEVEIRACGLHAVELLAAARSDLTAPAIDSFLWHRGQAPEYKEIPRHRARCRAY